MMHTQKREQRNACTNVRKFPHGMDRCEGTLGPMTEPVVVTTADVRTFACHSCGQTYTTEHAKHAGFQARERRRAIVAAREASSQANRDRIAADPRLTHMNSTVTVNGVPMLADTQSAWELAMNMAIRAVRGSTPAPTKLNE